MKTKIGLEFRKRKFVFPSRKCGFSSTGLILRTRNALPCLFEFKKPVKFKITSLFVFFPFLAIWFDKENKIIEMKIVKPFTFSVSPTEKFTKLLEIPINDKNKKFAEGLISDGEKFKKNIHFNFV